MSRIPAFKGVSSTNATPAAPSTPAPVEESKLQPPTPSSKLKMPTFKKALESAESSQRAKTSPKNQSEISP